MMAATTVEMHLEMAERLAALRLPAALLPSLLATAMQDFVDQAEPADANDRAALDQYARTLGRDIVADYVPPPQPSMDRSYRATRWTEPNRESPRHSRLRSLQSWWPSPAAC